MSDKNILTLPKDKPSFTPNNYGLPLTFSNIYDFKAGRQNYENWLDQILRNAKPFSIDDFNKMQYDQCLENLKTKYGFETTGWDDKLCCITFTRTVERGETHEVTLEDEEPEWLIFSCLKNSIKDWDGYMVDEQYPLTIGEYRLFVRLIGSIEQLYPLETKGD